jgi:3-hydroxyacyl-[acyl-carrier-protein] dehydratase
MRGREGDSGLSLDVAASILPFFAGAIAGCGGRWATCRGRMRFNLVDRIVEVVPGKMLRAVKYLTLGEEYLADHFPTFPVMPGVLMLEALVEASAWLLRLSDDFRHSVIVLREAKNVKYGTFMEPGRQMQVEVELIGQDEATATFKGKGEVNGASTVAARLTLGRYNLKDRRPAFAAADERIVGHLRSLAALLQAPRP